MALVDWRKPLQQMVFQKTGGKRDFSLWELVSNRVYAAVGFLRCDENTVILRYGTPILPHRSRNFYSRAKIFA